MGCSIVQGRNLGALGARAPPAFHTLAKDMSLTGEETHFTLFMYYLILPIINQLFWE